MIMFHAEAQTPPLAHGYIQKTYVSAETMSCCHAHQEGFLLSVSAHNVPPTHILWWYSQWDQVTYRCPSDALGKCLGLVLVPWQWPHVCAGNHGAHGNAIPCFLEECQNTWLYCRASCKRRYDLKIDFRYWATKDNRAHCNSWVNLPKRLC